MGFSPPLGGDLSHAIAQWIQSGEGIKLFTVHCSLITDHCSLTTDH